MSKRKGATADAGHGPHASQESRETGTADPEPAYAIVVTFSRKRAPILSFPPCSLRLCAKLFQPDLSAEAQRTQRETQTEGIIVRLASSLQRFDEKIAEFDAAIVTLEAEVPLRAQ
jgi:hypothetical protein